MSQPRTGETTDVGYMHTGQKIRVIGKQVFAVKYPMEEESSIIQVPEKHRAPYGKTQSGAPIQKALVLAVGPDCHEVKQGEDVLVHPLNTAPMKVGNVWYFFPTEIAIHARFTV